MVDPSRQDAHRLPRSAAGHFGAVDGRLTECQYYKYSSPEKRSLGLAQWLGVIYTGY
jgi:hypothetical protein